MHYSLILLIIIISEPYGQKCFRQKVIYVLVPYFIWKCGLKYKVEIECV